MKRKPFRVIEVALIVGVISGIWLIGFSADEESLGRAAEQSGKLREALRHYVTALQATPEGSSTEQQLRETIIKLARKLDPPPAVPEEAERRMARGRAAIESASSEQDFIEAATEFQKAARAAPWLPEAYFNLGVVYEKAGRYEEARRNLKLYLTAAPNASDAKQVREQLYKLEFQAEKANRQKEEERKKVEEARVRPYEALSGAWENPVDQRPEGRRAKYSLRITGPNHIEIWRDNDCVDFDCTSRRPRKEFDLTVSGNELSGIRHDVTYLTRNTCKFEVPVQGVLKSNGQRIVLRFQQVYVDNCIIYERRDAELTLIRSE